MRNIISLHETYFMKNIFILLFAVSGFISCKKEIKIMNTNDWAKRTLTKQPTDSLTQGVTYLSVYPEIYSQTEHKKHDLVVTASIRNINLNDTIYINKATYHDTKGKKVRTYFDKPIFITPLETVEIIINELDKTGGTGANFIFDWSTKTTSNEPLIEAVMISTYGQQGLSFTTQGKRIK